MNLYQGYPQPNYSTMYPYQAAVPINAGNQYYGNYGAGMTQVQPPQANMGMMNQSAVGNMQSMNNVSAIPQNNMNMNTMSNMALPNPPAVENQSSTSPSDIVWVHSDEEVFSYPVAAHCNQLFFNMQEMKMYTKEGATGLVRDFELHESPESIQRYQQMQQTQNMQFPIVDTTANVIDTERQADELISAIERKMEQRFEDFENKLSQLSENMNNGSNESSAPAPKIKILGNSNANK